MLMLKLRFIYLYHMLTDKQDSRDLTNPFCHTSNDALVAEPNMSHEDLLVDTGLI